MVHSVEKAIVLVETMCTIAESTRINTMIRNLGQHEDLMHDPRYGSQQDWTDTACLQPIGMLTLRTGPCDCMVITIASEIYF